MGSDTESTEPSAQANRMPINLLLSSSDKLCKFLSQSPQWEGGGNSFSL